MLTTEIQAMNLNIKLANLYKQEFKYFCISKNLLTSWSEKGSIPDRNLINDEFQAIKSQGWRYVDHCESLKIPVVYIYAAVGSNISDELWDLRSKMHSDSVICLWYFDNHIAHMNNFKTSISGDLNFLSHWLAVEKYLFNPYAPIVSHIPACSTQFMTDELINYLPKIKYIQRESKALFNYVIYDGAPRTPLLADLCKHITDIADFKLMPASDRTRYWNLNRFERYQEWSAYKTTVILPIVNDLSTRVFDALSAGMVPIVPETIEDLNLVVSPQLQSDLGIVRIKSYSIDELRRAINRAIEIFDFGGPHGIEKRVNYILNNGMLKHRISKLLQCVDDLGKGGKRVVFGKGPEGIGSYIVQV